MGDARGTVKLFNQRWYGYTCDQSGVDGAKSFSLALHPEDRAGDEKRWAFAIGQGTTYELELRLRRGDGAYRWQLAHALPARATSHTIVNPHATYTHLDHQTKAQQVLR